MISCTKILEFDAGHRLVKHESKCRNAHGHRYKVEVTCEAPQLDEVGRVVDFGCVKEVVGTWIDTYWDHGFIVASFDPLLDALATAGKVFIFDVEPTVENLASYLLGVANLLLAERGVRVTKIKMWETPTCYAEVTP